jgi:hypothetical protein
VSVVGGEVTPCIFIEFDDGVSPIESVAHANSRRLGSRPQLEILRPVVVADTVEMMNRLTGQEVPSDRRLEDQDVLKNVWVAGPGCPRVTRRPPRLCSVLPPFLFPF